MAVPGLDPGIVPAIPVVELPLGERRSSVVNVAFDKRSGASPRGWLGQAQP
jgi:hypothetical protein